MWSSQAVKTDKIMKSTGLSKMGGLSFRKDGRRESSHQTFAILCQLGMVSATGYNIYWVEESTGVGAAFKEQYGSFNVFQILIMLAPLGFLHCVTRPVMDPL
jgi:hypothetical protein